MKNISYFLLNRLTQTKTVATWTTVSLCLYLNYALGFLMFACAAAFCETKRCFVSLRLAAFFTACASRFQIAFIENSRLVDDCFIVFVFKLRSGVLDICLCSRKTCDRHSER